MPITTDEMNQIQRKLIAEHGHDVASLASMVSFFWNSTAYMKEARELNFVLLMKCVDAMRAQHGITYQAFENAIVALDTASKTAIYLDSLPD